MKPQWQYNYDYTKCMVMKLGLAHPDKARLGKSKVLMTFEQALDFIKKVDAITQGIPKIYYLVGWQYLGHDDKYPDFFEVNEALKREQDATAYDSFRWLCEEAKQYHSVVSVHINFNDAYDNAPSFDDFVRARALIRKKNGKPHAIEKYNGRACYKTCLKAYWESGLFKRQIDRFVELFPFIAETGTIHVDNFQCYKNFSPAVSIREMQDARRKMIAYVHEKGMDITSEFTYKETEDLHNRPIFGLPREHHRSAPMDTVGFIPMTWWCNRQTKKELVEVPPQVYCGGMFREKRYEKILYGNMHGEDILTTSNPHWVENFLHQFATLQVPCHFLCAHKRLAIEGFGGNLHCTLSDGIESFGKTQTIAQNGVVRKEGDTLLLPLVQKKGQYIAYSKNGDNRTWHIPEAVGNSAQVYAITENGNAFINTLPIKNGDLTLQIEPRQALLVVTEEA